MCYQQAHYITSKIIPEHPDYEEKIVKHPNGPVSVLYSDVLDFFKSTDKKNQVEELEDRLLHLRNPVEEDLMPFEVESPQHSSYLTPALPSKVEQCPMPTPFNAGEFSNQRVKVLRKPVSRSTTAVNEYTSPQIMFSSKVPEPQMHFPSPPKHSVSIPRSSSNLELAKSDLKLPITNVINSETLDGYMSRFSDSILFLDVRPRASFDAKRFPSANVVCIDAAILRDNLNEIDLEGLLKSSPIQEQQLFLKRHVFELVVFYDDTTNALDGLQPNRIAMRRLVDCIYTRAYLKPLKRAPCLLIGGLEAWVECMGSESVWKTYAQPSVLSSQTRPKSAMGTNGSSTYMRGVSDYFRSDNFGTSPEYTLTRSVQRTHLSMPSTVNSLQAMKQPQRVSASTISSPPLLTPQSIHQPSPSQQYQLRFSEFATGLVNLGNTCYMNCIIQCLIGTTRLGELFLKREYKAYPDSKLGYQGQLANVFARLVSSMYQAAVECGRGRVSYIAPKEIKYVCGRLSESFQGSEQQDCHEFLNFILDGLHEDLNARGNKPPLAPLTEKEERAREEMDVLEASNREWMRHINNNESPISHNIQGQYLSRLQCRVCGCQSTTYNAFSCLSVPIRLGYREVTLDDCFKLFTQPELLEGADAWNCPRCKKCQPTIKTIMLTRLPNFLIVHLKRFAHTGGVWGSNKLGTHVRYPGELDLSPFCLRRTASTQEPTRSNKFKLYAVANHYGSLKGGHYTSYVKREGQLGWCLYDDTRVRAQVSPQEVVNKNGYVLFYERVR